MMLFRIDNLDSQEMLNNLQEYRKTLDQIKTSQFVADKSISTKQVNTDQPYDIQKTTTAYLQNFVICFRYSADNQDYPIIIPFVQVTKTDGTAIDINNSAGNFGIQSNTLLLNNSNPKSWDIIYSVLQNAVGSFTYRYKLYIYSTDTGVVQVVGNATI